jgi:hypothetical protein
MLRGCVVVATETNTIQRTRVHAAATCSAGQGETHAGTVRANDRTGAAGSADGRDPGRGMGPGSAQVQHRAEEQELGGPGSGERRFSEVSGNGTISADGEVSGTVAVAAASIDSNVARRDAHLRSADFFGSGNYPDITFTADGTRPSGRGVTVTDALTVRGRTLPCSPGGDRMPVPEDERHRAHRQHGYPPAALSRRRGRPAQPQRRPQMLRRPGSASRDPPAVQAAHHRHKTGEGGKR